MFQSVSCSVQLGLTGGENEQMLKVQNVYNKPLNINPNIATSPPTRVAFNRFGIGRKRTNELLSPSASIIPQYRRWQSRFTVSGVSATLTESVAK